MFDFERLMKIAEEKATEYQSAKPFPHIVIDDAITEGALIEDAFPAVGDLSWYAYDNPLEKKYAFDKIEALPGVFKFLFAKFNSSEFCLFLEKLTGIPGIIPDPHFRGGGLHQIIPGGKLDIHADFNWHPKLKIMRKVNVILFLNSDWQEEWGGHLELWDKEMTKAEMKILPIVNRMAIFNTDDTSYHGHPDELKCPEGRSRKSIATYYYTALEVDVNAHSTVYKKRPGESSEHDELREQRAKGRL